MGAGRRIMAAWSRAYLPCLRPETARVRIPFRCPDCSEFPAREMGTVFRELVVGFGADVGTVVVGAWAVAVVASSGLCFANGN